MNKPVLVAALSSALLFGTALAKSASSSWQTQLDAFTAKADAERKRLKLDAAGAKQKYPTPELTLKSESGDAVVIAPGGTTLVQFEGKVPEASLFQLQCDSLEAAVQGSSQKGFTARVTAKPYALPELCFLHAIAPVSLTRTSVPAVRIDGTYELELELGNGKKTKWTLKGDPNDDDSLTGTSKWEGNERPVRVSRNGSGYRAEVGLSDEETEKANEATGKAGEEMRDSADLQALQALSEKMQAECSKLAPEKMAACFTKYQPQLEAASKKIQKQSELALTGLSVHPTACLTLEMEFQPDGRISGKAQGCQKPGTVDFTGNITAAR